MDNDLTNLLSEGSFSHLTPRALIELFAQDRPADLIAVICINAVSLSDSEGTVNPGDWHVRIDCTHEGWVDILTGPKEESYFLDWTITAAGKEVWPSDGGATWILYVAPPDKEEYAFAVHQILHGDEDDPSVSSVTISGPIMGLIGGTIAEAFEDDDKLRELFDSMFN